MTQEDSIARTRSLMESFAQQYRQLLQERESALEARAEYDRLIEDINKVLEGLKPLAGDALTPQEPAAEESPTPEPAEPQEALEEPQEETPAEAVTEVVEEAPEDTPKEEVAPVEDAVEEGPATEEVASVEEPQEKPRRRAPRRKRQEPQEEPQEEAPMDIFAEESSQGSEPLEDAPTPEDELDELPF